MAVGRFPVLQSKPARTSARSLGILLGVCAILAAGSLAWMMLRSPGPDPKVLASVVATKKGDAKDCPVVTDQKLVFAPAPSESGTPPAQTGRPKGSALVAGQVDTASAASVSAKGRDPRMMASRIDAEIDKKLHESNLVPSPIAGDAEFLRRVSLDLTGRIPSKERTVDFLASSDPAKRSKLIDELLASEQFGKNFAWYWRDLIAKREGEYQFVPNEPVFVQWMAQQYNRNPYWDKIVHAMLTAKGEEMTSGDTYLFFTNQDQQQPAPDKLAGTITTLFMGNQLQCAECHVHPIYKDWEPKDFWGIASFFAHTRTDRAGDKKKAQPGTGKVTEVGLPMAAGKGGAKKAKEIAANPPGTLKIPDPTQPNRTIGTAKATVFGGSAAPVMDKTGYRPFLAEWFVSSKNVYFAPAHVNRMWSYFFAAGFVNPIDDMRPDNSPSHPELLQALANEFTASDYDIKHLMRCICNSKAYQRTSRSLPGNEEDSGSFSRMPVRVLTPHQLFDSLAVATGRDLARGGPNNPAGKKKDNPLPKGPDALIQVFDTRDYDENPAEFTYGIPQVLRLMNRQLGNVCDDAARKAATLGSPEQVIEHLYLTALSRRPTSAEVQRMQAFIQREGNPIKGYAGVFWALLNSAEFMCNR